MKYIKDYDVEVYNAILEEEKRQEEGIELIASENFVSKAVMEAAGSEFLEQSLQMFSRTQGRRLTWEFMFHCWKQEIKSLEWV